MRNTMRWIRSIVLIVPILLIGQESICFAQATGSGEIRGTVSDTTGALIPGVTVTVLNVATGVSKDYTTNQDGLFDTAGIVIGSYKLTFAKSGFEQLVRGPITVQVGFTTVNTALHVGSATEHVEVNATDLPLLQTETHEQSITLEAKDLSQLPQVGQNWANFTLLIPGIQGTTSGGSAASPGTWGSANGTLPFSNVSQDGSSTIMANTSSGTVAVLDNVAELQVQTSSFSAQYGLGGIQYNQITKGGTSQFHGSLYEYMQNDALNAYPYEFGESRADLGPVTFLRYHNFGGSIGGPVLKMKKMFFYFNFDKTLNDSGANSGYASLPTDAVLSGDFSGPGFYTIYDPTTQVVNPDGSVTRKSFKDEYGTNAVPASMFDPVAKFIATHYLPTPENHPSTGQFVPGQFDPTTGFTSSNYHYVLPNKTRLNKYFGRLDYDVTPKHRITLSDSDQDNPGSTPSLWGCPIGCQVSDVEDISSQASDVWNINSHLINTARFGFTTQLNFFEDGTTGKGYPAQMGLQFSKADTFPTLNYGGYWAPGPATNAILKQFTFDPSDVVTLIHGRHILNFGGEFLAYQVNQTAWGNIQGASLSFASTYTTQFLGSTNTGNSFASFLLGYASNWSALVQPEYGARYKTPQMFVQDDFKIKPNLTLNLGLRYTVQHGWNEVKGNMATFDPKVLNPATGTLGAYWYGTTHANNRHALMSSIWSDVLPRVGFAWLPRSNMTVRGGFGMYVYNYALDRNGEYGMGGVYESSGNIGDQTNGRTPVVLLSGSGSNLPYTAASTDPARFNNTTVTYVGADEPDMKNLQWNLAVQQAIGSTLVAQLAYVGNHVYNMQFLSNIDQIPPSELYAAYLNSFSGTSNLYLQPYPQYTGIQAQSGFLNAVSNYNSLQASITKRAGQGLSFNFSYVWSHFLDDADNAPDNDGRVGVSSVQNTYDPAANYGTSNYDVRSAFKGYAVYELPFGIGRKFLNHNRILDAGIGGWNLSGTFVAQSGQPFTVLMNVASYSGNTWYPDRIGNPRLKHQSITEWFDPTAFARPVHGAYGNNGRNTLRGPGLSQLNLTAGKTFSVWENVKVQIRADATNALNHPSWGAPANNLNCPTEGVACDNNPLTTQIYHSLSVGGRTMQLGAHLTF